MSFKKGDKVKILRRDISGLLCPYGVVTRVDGSLVYVRPVWQGPKRMIELYNTEVELATPTWTQEMFDWSYTKCPYCGHKKMRKRSQ